MWLTRKLKNLFTNTKYETARQALTRSKSPLKSRLSLKMPWFRKAKVLKTPKKMTADEKMDSMWATHSPLKVSPTRTDPVALAAAMKDAPQWVRDLKGGRKKRYA